MHLLCFFVLSDHPDSDYIPDIETGSPWRCFSISSKRFISCSICPRLSRIVMLRRASIVACRHETGCKEESSENLKALASTTASICQNPSPPFFSTKKDQRNFGYFCLRPKKLLGNVSLHLFPQLVLQPGD